MEVTKASGIPVAKRGLVAGDARVSSPFPCVTDDRRENKKEPVSPPKTNQRLQGDPEIVHQAVENNVRQWLLNSGQGLGYTAMATTSVTRVAPPPPARSVTLQQSSRVSCAPSVVSSPGGRESSRSAAMRPHAMRKTLSDNSGDFRGTGADGRYLETRFSYSVHGALGSAAQASAAAAFFARATQKMNLTSPQRRMKRQGSEDDVNPMEHSFATNFYALLRRNPPPAPTNLLRRLAARENPGVGKVRVMLRICGSSDHPAQDIDFLALDKKRKQIALQEPSPAGLGVEIPAVQERRIGIAAPKMFAFDGLFTHEDSQADVATSVLSDIIAAVINGSDGCVFTFGDSSPSTTALGSCDTGANLGLIPTAIAWLFRGITEQKVKTGARFSVRVSAVEVSGPNEVLRDLLASHATESEQSPGVYLRDDPLLGTQLQNQSELRAPSLEKAAFYLDAALSARSEAHQRFSHLLYTLHVYQYSLDKSGRGGVAGGRSRLHLLDLGTSRPSAAGSANGLSLSALSSVLVALFNGQRHLPHRDRKITQLLRECLSSLTCQAALVAHVSADSSYSEALTTAQMASRIHRMRRRRMKNFGGVGAAGEDSRVGRSSGEESSASADPSSSEQSCDTVIYMGPTDDATDGEHPPVYLPSLNSGDNRCAMSRALRGSTAEDSDGSRKSRISTPVKESKIPKISKSPTSAKSPQVQRKSGLKGAEASPVKTAGPSSSDEQWIDGPRLHKSRVPEVRSIVRANQVETWIDGPSAVANTSIGYGYMDDHKRGMIRHWVETQTAQATHRFPVSDPANHASGAANQIKVLTVFKTCDEADPAEQESPSMIPVVPPKPRLTPSKPPLLPKPSERVIEQRRREKQLEKEDEQEASLEELCFQCDELVESLKEIPDISTRCETIPEADSEDERASSRRTTHDDYNQEFIEVEEPSEPVAMQDSCLQVTEEDIVMSIIALDGAGADSSDQSSCGGEEHPLRVLSQENLTIVSHFTGETYSQGTASEWEYTNVTETGTSADDSVFFKSHLEHLTRLQQIYEPSGGLLHPPSLTSVAPHITSFKDLPLCSDWNIPSPEPIRKMSQDPPPRSSIPIAPMSRSLESNLEPIACIPRGLSSLRHPDGASNPQLNQYSCAGSIYERLEKRLPGNGASKSDSEQENSRISLEANILERIPAGKSDSEVDESLNAKKSSAKTPKLGRIFRGSSKKLSPAAPSPKNDKRSSSKCRDAKNSPTKGTILSPKLKNGASVAHKSPKRDTIRFNSKREVKSYGFSYESCQQVASSSLCPSEGYESGGSDSAVSPYLSPAKGRRHVVPGFQDNRHPGKHFSSNTGTGGSGGSGGHYASSGYESVLRDSECSSLGSSQDSDRETRAEYGKTAIINGQSSSCNIL